MTYDIIGNIAIIKGEGKTRKEKIVEAKQLLNGNIKTVLEKASDVRGRLRTIKTKFIAGEKTKETVHKESECLFKLNIETCYFSPRMSNDRLEVAKKIRKKDRVLVMFAGIGAYPIIIYKTANPKEIVGIEISSECNKYFKENLKLNKIPAGKIKIIPGDVRKKITKKTAKKMGKFDVIVMARPNLGESFLKQGLKASKKGTKIFYHGFCRESELEDLKNQLIYEAWQLKRKIKIVKVVKAGEIAPYKFRWRIEMKVLK